MTDGPAVPPKKLTTRSRATIASVIILVGVILGWQLWWRSDLRARRSLAQAKSLRLALDLVNAERTAATALRLDPRLGEAGFLAAECAIEQREFSRAVDHLKQISSAVETRTRLRALMMVATLYQQRIHRLWEAEQAYRTVLELAPDHVDANAELAKLLSLCGRMREAVPYALRLIKLQVETDLLVLLSSESGVVKDQNALTQASATNPQDPNLLQALAWHAADKGDHSQAIAFLRLAIQQVPDQISPHIALGQQLLAARQFAELESWARQLPPAADRVGETWYVRAGMAEHAGDVAQAIRYYWQGLRIAPANRAANVHLIRLLSEVGERKIADQFTEYLRQIQTLESVQNRILFSPVHNPEELVELAKAYEAAGRLWEAYGWCRFANGLDPSERPSTEYLVQIERRIQGLPLQLVDDSANVAMTVDLSTYVFSTGQQRPAAHRNGTKKANGRFSFHDDALMAGLRFQYFNGSEKTQSRRMFEFTGGGVGVIDFDLDGYADLFLTQGCLWPPGQETNTHCDRLFRNQRGTGHEDITPHAGIQEAGFGQGCAVGDFNADGFPDVYVANIGANQLWVNNGDGTFTDATRLADVGGNEWTTSCVMADLNGDGLPDIYAVNYVTADDVFDRVCHHPDGSPKMCMPFDFLGQRDRFWLNDGDGHFTDATATALSIEPTGMGLGCAVWDAHGKGHLSLLVANDTTPNFFFVNEAESEGRFLLRERGIELGLALTGDGKATGCMGIALGDVDGDGQLDVNITNFLGESNTLYMSSSTPGFFDDRTEVMGLHQPTARVLGFGTQFLDADLDGQLEMFMTNGHIDDLTKIGRPYHMPPLFFCLNDGRFAEVTANQLGPYFQRRWLGRSAVRLDWNRDGRDDLVVGHLFDNYALLTNTTPDTSRFLSIRLVGTRSNRDAIGTILESTVDSRKTVHQLTAGDGYQASNERRLIIGVGSANKIDKLQVRWPSGLVQQFTNIQVPKELILVEDRTPMEVTTGVIAKEIE